MFMKPQVYKGQYFAVETTEGTEFVPSDVIGRTVGTAAEAFENYVKGNIEDPDECIECKSGWLARMNAPGYLDCTEWCAYDSETEAWEELLKAYGDDEPGSLTYRWLPAEWASPLVNGDHTGLSDSEDEELSEWMEGEPTLDFLSANCIGDPVFQNQDDAGHRMVDACLFLFTIKDAPIKVR